YGRRMAAIARTLGIEVVELNYAENAPIVPADIGKSLADDAGIAMVTCCHCETTSGILNPIAEVGRIVQAAGRDFYVDAMSSFGAIDTNVAEMGIDYLVSSANKCIEGVPGFSFCVAKLDKLLACEGNARSVSLDLVAQYKGLETNGQFRFTPPTHVILAFHQALLELEGEGGVAARGKRYRDNHEIIAGGMTAMGFRRYLAPEYQAPIITSFYYPDDPNFDFTKFYSLLAERGYVIYPGKVGDADCFRIGNIGRLFPNDMRDLLSAVSDVLAQMDVRLKGVA
ncbi:2-aminoethylphosphonate--pyruvate transaminase, partial [bacterium]|nr:2-aminoethylphosphonate--pyruvate transaminase [bacterium]